MISLDEPEAEDTIRAHAGDVIHAGGRAPVL